MYTIKFKNGCCREAFHEMEVIVNLYYMIDDNGWSDIPNYAFDLIEDLQKKFRDTQDYFAIGLIIDLHRFYGGKITPFSIEYNDEEVFRYE